MGRKSIPPEEKKIGLTIMIESKHVTEENKEELREIAYKAILTHLEQQKQ